MNVAELSEYLKDRDPDMEVCVLFCDGEHDRHRSVGSLSVTPRNGDHLSPWIVEVSP